MSESENNNEENKQWIESESLEEKNQLNICNSTARQILKKQITYSPGAAHTSLNNIGLNRYNSFNTKEEDSTEANLLKVKKHDNTLANNHNLSYESRMSSVNDFLFFCAKYIRIIVIE